MDIKTLLNNLHEEVSCSLCKTTFTDPKQLPCLHSFCLQCLNEILRKSGRHDVITCHECKRESRVPSSGNLNDLPASFRINSLLEVLAIKQCSTTGVKCENCDERSFQSCYCFQCCVFWCDFCVNAHNIIRANKEHRMLALTDFKDEDYENFLKRPAFCQKKHHGKEELTFFCKICESPICKVCALTDHEGHAKIPLEEAANESKVQVKSVIESKKKNVQQQKTKIRNIEQTCIQVQEQAAAVKKNAQKFGEALMCVIEAKMKEIYDEVDNRTAELLQILATQKSDIEHEAEMTETVIGKTETLLERGKSAEIVHLGKSADEIFPAEGVRREVEQVDCELEDSVRRRFNFEENETLIDLANTEGIGSLQTLNSGSQANTGRKGFIMKYFWGGSD